MMHRFIRLAWREARWIVERLWCALFALPALAVAGAAVAQRAAITPEDLYERVAPSIWLVENEQSDERA